MTSDESHSTRSVSLAVLTTLTSIGVLSLILTSNTGFGIIWTAGGLAGLLGATVTGLRDETPPSEVVPWVCFLIGVGSAFTILMLIST